MTVVERSDGRGAAVLPAADGPVVEIVPFGSSPAVGRGTVDRELAALVVAAAAAGWLVDAPLAWAVAALAGLAALVGTSAIVADEAHLGGGAGRVVKLPGRRLVPGLVPAVVALAGSLALHALPARLELAVGLVGLGLLVAWSVGLERRLALARGGAWDEDGAILLALCVAAAFVGFVGVGTLVENGLAGPALAAPMAESDLAVLVVGDAAIAGLLGLRLARLRAATRRNAVLGGLSSATIVAVAAASLRALAVPFLLGPALLTLVFFLWDALTGSTVARRRSARWAWELGLLALLGAAVTILNLRVG